MPLPEDPNRPEDPSRGVSAMVHTVGYLIDEFALELEFLGRGGLDRVHSHKAVLEGRHLVYELLLDDWVFVKAQGMDSPLMEELCHLADNAQSWRDVGFIIGALEKNEVKDVSKKVRPIQVGEPGPCGLVLAAW